MTIDLDELDRRLLADTDTVTLAWDELHGLLDRLRKAESQVADLRIAVVDALGESGHCMEMHTWPGHKTYDAMMTTIADCINLLQINGIHAAVQELMKREDVRRAVEFTKANP